MFKQIDCVLSQCLINRMLRKNTIIKGEPVVFPQEQTVDKHFVKSTSTKTP